MTYECTRGSVDALQEKPHSQHTYDSTPQPRLQGEIAKIRNPMTFMPGE
jgi:hypothetical protein